MTKIYSFDESPKSETAGKGTMYRLVSEVVGSTMLGVLLVELGPNVEYPGLHYHEHRESVYIVLEGGGTLLLNDKEHRLKPRMVVFISPGDTHGITRTGKEGLKMIEAYSPLAPDFVKVQQ